MTGPLFSILVVNYNHGSYIRDCIESIVTQNFLDYELLIVDAASSDNSVEIIKEYNSSINWWISEPDNGQSEAFNKGFRRAKGQYLLWVNADDILLPGALKNSNDLIQNTNCDWIAGNTIFFDKDRKIIKCSRGTRWLHFANGGCFIPVFGPSCIFRSSILKEVGGFDESLFYSMDTDLWIRFRIKGYKYYRLEKYIWGFRIHTQSKTSETHMGKKIDKMELEKKLIESRYSNDKFNWFRILFQRSYRVMDTSFFVSLFDTFLLKGSNILNFKKCD